MADINYVDPTSLSTIAGQNTNSPANPNIGPMQGMMQGQAFQRTNEFLDLSKQNELMNQARKKQELSEFMANAPMRQDATAQDFLAKTAQSKLQGSQAQYEMGRLPDANKIAMLKQHKDVSDAYAAMPQVEHQFYAQAAPSVMNTFDKDGNPTPETERSYKAFVEQHDKMFPNAPIGNDPTYGNPTPHAITTMKLLHDMGVQSPDYQQKSALQGQEYGYKGGMQEKSIAAEKEMATAKNDVAKELARMEWAGKMKIAEMEHGVKSKLQADTADAFTQWEENGRNKEGYAKLTPRQRALVDPDMFHRVFPQTSLGLDQLGMAEYAKSKGKTGGMFDALGIERPGGTNQQQPEPQIQPPSPPQEQGLKPGMVRNSRNGNFKYKGGPQNDPKSWEKVQ